MINTLNGINDAVKKDAASFIRSCEKEYGDQIVSLAKKISDNDDIKIVAIAGPSASGKTTTAHILMRELERLGETTAVISLDDFSPPTAGDTSVSTFAIIMCMLGALAFSLTP